MGDPESDSSTPAAAWMPPWEWSAVSIRALMKVRGDSAHTLTKDTYVVDRAVEGWIYNGRSPNPTSAKQLYQLWAELQPWQREVFDGLRADPSNGKDKEPPSLGNLRMVVVVLGLTPMHSPTLGKRLTDIAANVNGVATDRGSFIELLGKAGLTAACAPLERLAGLRTPTCVDDGYLADLESRGAALNASYASATSFDLLGDAREHANRLTTALDGEMLPRQRTRLVSLFGDAALLIGWLHQDLEQRADARAYFELAASLAHESADEILRARVLRCQSTLHSSVPRGGIGGHAGTALRFAEEATATLPPHANPHTRLQVLAREAVERAASRDPSLCRRLLDRAAKALSDVRAADPDRLAAEALVSVEGLCLTLLGRASDGINTLSRAAPHVSAGRQRANVLADLARAHVLNGDPEQACARLVAALGEATPVGYAVGVRRILGVRAGFDPRWADLACVRELDERLRLAV